MMLTVMLSWSVLLASDESSVSGVLAVLLSALLPSVADEPTTYTHTYIDTYIDSTHIHTHTGHAYSIQQR